LQPTVFAPAMFLRRNQMVYLSAEEASDACQVAMRVSWV